VIKIAKRERIRSQAAFPLFTGSAAAQHALLHRTLERNESPIFRVYLFSYPTLRRVG
jgi:hypothetical protein